MNLLDPETLQKIANIKQSDPDRYREFVDRLAATFSRDKLEQERFNLLCLEARTDRGIRGFRAWYEVSTGGVLLPHLDRLAVKAFEAHDLGEIFLTLGFRGSRKTTTLIISLCSFLHGHYPELTGIITGAADPNAKLIAKSIAQIIDLHPVWKQVFPNVIPYKERGWGAEGYWLRDNRKSVEEWAQQQAAVNDPTFVGGGYKSAEINGKHPSLYLAVDDLHDIDSSASVTEREYIKTVFLTQILKTVLRENDKLKTWVLMTGVPFAKDDTYAVLKDGGGVTYIELPVMKRVAEGQGTYIDGINPKTGKVYDDIVGWWEITEPKLMGKESIINERSRGKGAFWQMYMIDIAIAKTAGIKYYLYDHTKIGFDLPTGGGADPTSIDPDYEVGGKKRSSFALAYICKLPNGTLVLKGGVLKQMGIQTAKDAILQAQSMFKNWITTAVENVGPGKIFMQFLRLDSRVRFRDSGIANPKGIIKDKMARFDAEVAPWLESGVLLISDEENPYCMAVRNLCDNFFDIDPKRPNEALDAGDGLYHGLKLFPEVLRNHVLEEISPVAIKSSLNRGGLWHPMLGARTN
jgi:hypothetical protein